MALLGFLAAGLLAAQRNSFRVYAEPEGLTDLNVNSMLQDKAGFLWVATKNGLFRFDGHHFRRYGVEAGMPSSEAWTLLETSDGTLWVVTRGGVARKVNDRFEKVDTGTNRLPFGMNDLAEDRSSVSPRVYLATKEGLLYFSDDLRRSTVPGTEGEPIWSVAPARTAGGSAPGVWYARSDAICYWNGRDNHCYGRTEGIIDGPVGGLVISHDGTVWARSSKRLVALPPGALSFEPRDQGLSYAGLRGYASLDSHGVPMIPTETGLARWTGKGWSLMGASDGLDVPSTSWGLEDREGSIWIGMQGGGLARWLGSGEWENWTSQQGLKNEQVWAIRRDHNGRLLTGLSGGIDALSQIDATRRRLVHVPAGRLEIAGNRFMSLAVDPDNSIWVGTSAAGLGGIDAKTGRLSPLGVTATFASGSIGSVFVDENNAVWVIANAGVYSGTRRGNSWTWNKEPVPQADAEVFLSGIEDHDGRIWVATTMGLAVREAGHWSRPGMADGLPVRLVNGLAAAPDGSTVVSYVDSVDLFDVRSVNGRRTVTKIPYAGNQAPTSTYFLGFDLAGNLWRGTGSGVYVRVNGHWIQYTHQDGLVWNGTNMNAFFADPDGSVWIGTARGLSHHLVSPAADMGDEHQKILPAYIVDVQAGGNRQEIGGVPRIDYRSSSLLIGFASPVFRRDKDVRFRYRLRNHDVTWTETSEWEAHYTDLKPGNYTFEVASGRWNGRWSDTTARLPIIITGPWWTARWFTASCIGFLVLCVLVAWRLRDLAQVRNARELRIAVRRRTAELERERGFERSRNRILESLVSDQSLIPILDGIARLVCEQIPGSDCAILLRQSARWRVACAHSVPKHWIEAALDAPGGIPPAILSQVSEFELSGKYFEPGESPERATGPDPGVVRSVPVGLSDSPHGAVLLFSSGLTGPEPWQPILETSARLAQIAIEHRHFCDDLQFQAQHDSLTGLPNRALFDERLKVAVLEAAALKRQLAVIYVDLDGFKEINDRISHRAGDGVLEEVARRMQVAMRERDTVARIGGDEFNILVPDIADAAAAAELARRLIEAVAQPLLIEGHRLSITASIGVSIFPNDSTDAANLQRQADAAMYHAKSLGKNRAESFGDNSRTPDHVRMEQEPQRALRGDLLALDSQPKFSAEAAGLESAS